MSVQILYSFTVKRQWRAISRRTLARVGDDREVRRRSAQQPTVMVAV
jgi:hypothetical protein